ncbi:MAG: hypothetical protein WHV67_03760 [Thermoanaerobaculia bacterium]
MEKIFESFLDLFHPFLNGPQPLDFLKEQSKNFIKNMENLPQKNDSLEVFLHRDFFFQNSYPFPPSEKNFQKYFEAYLLFEKLNMKGLIIKRNIKEENFIFWLQEFQKGEVASDPWIKVIKEKDGSNTLNLKFDFLTGLYYGASLISQKRNMEKSFEEGKIISYIPIREKIQKLYKILSSLGEKSLCLLPFFTKEDEKFLPHLILNYVFLSPLNISTEKMEDLLFASLFYDVEDKGRWIPLIQSRNFSDGGFLAFLASCNHPSIIFTLFYSAKKYLEFYYLKEGTFNPAEALQKFLKLEDISEDIKDYVVWVLGKIPPSSPALTEECEPCLVISKKEIAQYENNKFILKEGKGEKPVPFEQFPFNPLYIILNLEEI